MIRRHRRSRTAESLACQELVELVTDYLEGALEPDLIQALEEHLSACGNCTEYLRQMRRTIELERQLGDLDGSLGGGAQVGPSPLIDGLLAAFRSRHPT